VATSASSYRRSWYGSIGVPIVTKATANGVALAGAGVSLEVRDPRGRAVTGTTTTGSNGSVTINYSVRSDAPTGTYAVTSRVTQGTSTVAATTTFTVQ